MRGSQTHLSTEAISAYVDGELSAGPRERAVRHIGSCLECAYAVGVQQQAKESLSGEASEVAVPQSLLSRLGEIPFSAELAGSFDELGIYASESGRFEFRVAAPAARPRDTRASSNGRRRSFRGGAVAVALVSAVAVPAGGAHTQHPVRGHQSPLGHVVQRPADHGTSDATH